MNNILVACLFHKMRFSQDFEPIQREAGVFLSLKIGLNVLYYLTEVQHQL